MKYNKYSAISILATGLMIAATTLSPVFAAQPTSKLKHTISRSRYTQASSTITAKKRTSALVALKVKIIASAARTAGITTKLSVVGDKLDKRVIALSKKGKDISSLDTMYTNFQAKIASATASYQQAKTEASAVDVSVTDIALLKKANDTLKDARAKIASAASDLKDARAFVTTMQKAIVALSKK